MNKLLKSVILISLCFFCITGVSAYSGICAMAGQSETAAGQNAQTYLAGSPEDVAAGSYLTNKEINLPALNEGRKIGRSEVFANYFDGGVYKCIF